MKKTCRISVISTLILAFVLCLSVGISFLYRPQIAEAEEVRYQLDNLRVENADGESYSVKYVNPDMLNNPMTVDADGICLFTAGHPLDAGVRRELLEFGKPIVIGDDVWIGGNVTVNPGVTIGSNVVIGSGSVVTKDIPSGVVAAGNPCRVLRELTDKDRAEWEAQKQAYWDSKK